LREGEWMGGWVGGWVGGCVCFLWGGGVRVLAMCLVLPQHVVYADHLHNVMCVCVCVEGVFGNLVAITVREVDSRNAP
jgi:hypothetical protein